MEDFKAIPQVDKEYMIFEYINGQYEQLTVVLPRHKAEDYLQKACICPDTRYILAEVVQYKYVRGD